MFNYYCLLNFKLKVLNYVVIAVIRKAAKVKQDVILY